MNPTFITDRLLVRPRQIRDLEQCIRMDQDPLVTQYIQGPWSDPAKHRRFVIERISTIYPPGLGYWSVTDKHDTQDLFLGWVLLLPNGCNETEIGWRFMRSSWGKGYATEAASIILDHAFVDISLSTVVADINPTNFSSIRVAAKLGMKYTEDRVINGELLHSYQIADITYRRLKGKFD